MREPLLDGQNRACKAFRAANWAFQIDSKTNGFRVGSDDLGRRGTMERSSDNRPATRRMSNGGQYLGDVCGVGGKRIGDRTAHQIA